MSFFVKLRSFYKYVIIGSPYENQILGIWTIEYEVILEIAGYVLID